MKFYLSLALFGILSAQSVLADIVDCPVIHDNGIIYESHSNYVEAYADTKENEDFRNRKILWHTELLESDKVRNPHLEGDVQWNITCVEHIIENNLIVSDGRDRRFTLDKNTGKLLKTNRYELFYSAWVNEEPIYKSEGVTKLKIAGDWLFTLKRIDYINHSAMIIYKDPNETVNNYDILFIDSHNDYYLLSSQNLKNTTTILTLFEQDKPLDITQWQAMNAKEHDDWYDKKYIMPKLRKMREQ